MIGLAGLSLFAAPATASPSFAGYYETSQMEVAGGLDLKLNGKFRYALSYGAVDEEGEGDWTSDGKTVRLTSNPMPKGPTFELVRDDPAPKGQVWMTFDKSELQLDRPRRCDRYRRGHDRQGFGDRIVRRRSRRFQAGADPDVDRAAGPGLRHSRRHGPARPGARPSLAVPLPSQRPRPGGLQGPAADQQRFGPAARPLRHHDSLFAGPDLQGAGESEAWPKTAAK